MWRQILFEGATEAYPNPSALQVSRALLHSVAIESIMNTSAKGR